jgi:hypothetical protein
LQCKTHWGGIKRDIAKFCGAYSKVRSTYCSGQPNDMVMEKAHKWYKGQNQNKPFTLEYLWRDVTPRVSKPHDYANHMFMRL